MWWHHVTHIGNGIITWGSRGWNSIRFMLVLIILSFGNYGISRFRNPGFSRNFYEIFDTHRKYRKLASKILLIIFPKISRIFIFWHFDNLVKFTIVPVWSLCLNFYEFSWIKTAWHESGLSKSGIINRPTDQKFNSLTTIKMQFEKCQKRQFLVSKSQKLASHR